MFYYPNLNIVYCPIERTASRSTEAYLFAHDPSGYRLGPHRHSCSIEELDGLNPSKIYVSTRHPWDRLCSMFAADKLKENSGYSSYWTTIDEYLDFQLAHKDKEFLLEGNSVIPNLVSWMGKLINEDVIHFYRSQYSYLSVLSSLNPTLLPYEQVGLITSESWVDSNILFDHIGETDNDANSLWTIEREAKLKLIFENDYSNYADWSV
jgi:hypothetical protein